MSSIFFMAGRGGGGMVQEIEERPWGFFKVLSDDADSKVKRIVVYPGRRLSLQRHRLRSEHWFILSGTGVATINNTMIDLREGQSVDIPLYALHRVANTGQQDLVIIEVQTGNEFREDDIERIEDDYGRANPAHG